MSQVKNSSRIAALFARSGRKPRPAHTGMHCPACGEPLEAADHAVFMRGEAYHAGCVLYQPRVRPGGWRV